MVPVAVVGCLWLQAWARQRAAPPWWARMGKEGGDAMIDGQDFSIAAGWGLAGLLSSALVVTMLLPGPSAVPERTLTERAVHSLSRETCQHMLRSFADELGSGDPAAWLWTEESTALASPAVMRTKRSETAAPPRPYAFRPGTGVIPEQACSFPANSLYVISYETVAQPGVFVMTSQIE
ncbi:hypothetical protein [Azospirillum doebereinerae]|uniref:Uncharacterized protein n=1 Tax=Azospirillum doebereinerae TaxID=92933 RepID=A0A433J6H9_9PROT|nr:hypothetical protein [Azospirillum doebereinerae]MCG5239434.1 hypothetical protein [Azospirillum doebereinerae]RUQ68521.1 hypothetical protein EJ913_18040 [Azospirillum doebereinerae]